MFTSFSLLFNHCCGYLSLSYLIIIYLLFLFDYFIVIWLFCLRLNPREMIKFVDFMSSSTIARIPSFILFYYFSKFKIIFLKKLNFQTHAFYAKTSTQGRRIFKIFSKQTISTKNRYFKRFL